MRVHELAKEYGIKSTEFVDVIQEFGIDIKSHLSSLDDAQVSDIRHKMTIKDQIDDAHQFAKESIFNEEDAPPEVKEWIQKSESVVDDVEIVTNPSKVDLHESEQLEEVVEEVAESLTQEVVIEEPPRGFFGWLKHILFS